MATTSLMALRSSALPQTYATHPQPPLMLRTNQTAAPLLAATRKHSPKINNTKLVPNRLITPRCVHTEASKNSTASPPEASHAGSRKAGAVQEMCVYEFNERDRNSPAYLPFSLNFQFNFRKGVPNGAVGDLILFTNKIYDGTLQMRLGISAGTCTLIKYYPEKDGQRYEASFSFYFGDYGHISMQGAYLTFEDSFLAVTGGTGIFAGVYGTVKLHQITFPNKFLYTFYLQGIDDLPEELTRVPVPPSPSVKPSFAAARAMRGATAPNYTD